MLNLIRNTVSNFRLTKAKQDANNFLAAAGITGQVQSQAIYNLVNDLQASGLWSKMKAVYPMVTDNKNQLQYTNTFNSTFYKSDGTATITANYTTAPDGTNTAARMLGNTASSYMYYNINDGLGSGNRTYSIYLKAGTDTNVLLTFNSDGTTVSQSVTLTSSWQRFQLTKNITNSNSGFYITVENVGSGLDLFMWGIQVEFGSTASTYQPILTTPAAFMASQMKYNLKDARDLDAAFRLTWSGGWTYSATGATPNGTNAYADTKLAPSAILSSSSTHLSYYSRTNNTFDAIDMGAFNSTLVNNQIQICINYSGNYDALNNSPTVLTRTWNTDGLFIASRTLSTSYKSFRNNVLLGTRTISTNGNVNNNIWIGARNNDGSFTNRQVAFSSIGDGLTDQDASLLNQIVEKYQVALSRGVQAAQSFYYNSAYSNEANTYLYSTQITGTTQVSAINTLINGLKANNLWTKMKAVYPFVTDYRNLLGYTEDFTNAFWNKYGTTITGNTIIAPNGTLTADTLQENTLNTEHNIRTTLNGLIPSEIYTYSNYVKYNDRRYMRITVFYDGGIYPYYYATFDILNGVFVSQFGVSGATIIGSSITADNNGWYRITVSGQLGAFSSNIVVQTNLLNDSLAQVYTGTSKSTYIWGAQFELGSSATAYQPVLAANSSSTFMSSQMKFNLVNPQDSDAAFRLAFSGGWTYSTNGAQPNGTNGWANTNLNPVGLINGTNSHMSYYSRTNSDGLYADLGHGGAMELLTKFGNVYYADYPDSTRAQAANTSSLGNFIISNTSANGKKVFKNATTLISSAFVNANFSGSYTLVISNYNNLVPARYSNRQLSFVTIGDGLTDAEAAILYQLTQQYQTDLSRQV